MVFQFNVGVPRPPADSANLYKSTAARRFLNIVFQVAKSLWVHVKHVTIGLNLPAAVQRPSENSFFDV